MTRLDDPDFEQFACAQIPRLQALARVLTGNDHDGWDLVQDALARVGARWSYINNKADPFAYTRRTLINLSLNRRRRQQREVLTADVPERIDAHNLPERGLDNSWLELALGRLSKQQRAAIVLAYLEDQSIEQIAELLGCSSSTAKTHLARGRDVLRAAAPEKAPAAIRLIDTQSDTGD